MPTSRHLLLCLVALLAVAGCGGNGGETSTDGTVQAGTTRSTGTPIATKPTCPPSERRQLVFGKGLDRGVGFFSARADGSDRVDLTHGGNFGKGLAISPDGCRVAYVAEGDLLPNGQEQEPGLLITNADGSGDSQSALLGQIPSQSDLAWSPDGKQIAIADGYQLTLYDIASGKTKPLQFRGLDLVDSPSWSPDGSQIAFAGATKDDLGPDGTLIMPDVYVVGVAGGQPRLVRKTPGYAEDEISWSPDGRWIAFVDTSASTEGTTGPADHFRRGIFLLSPDGRVRKRLTKTTGSRPSWLPDSSAVVYARNECHGGPPAKFGPCSGQTIVAVPLNGGPDRPLFGPKIGIAFPGAEYARDAGMP